ncbi:MAG TPA: CHAP domain-containing protein [Thermoleophilia bacterium]|nr:CHAP domain-containing protein [Thermoleophilia bacterium]
MNLLTKQITTEAHRYIGLKETSRNSGPEIDLWLRRVDQKPGASWCAAFAWCMLDDAITTLGLTNYLPPTASVHRLFERARQFHAWWPEPGPGMIFGIDHGGGLGHCGIVIDVDGVHLATIEGNTNKAGEREGRYVLVRTRAAKECTLGYLDPGLLLVGQTCDEAHPENG